jgi:hypothetical protein
MPLDLNETATYGECIDRLKALSHPPYWNTYFIDGDGRKVFVRVETFVEGE